PRAIRPTSQPRAASSRAVARPTPAEAPVTATTLPSKDMPSPMPAATAWRTLLSTLAAMDVLVAGGHGQIARRLLRLLARNGDNARGLIRNPDHAADLESDGAHPVLCDLERDDVRPHVGGAEAIVFAA